MRILILGNVPPGLIGGAEVQALHLGRRWAAAGHPVLIAGPANKPAHEERLSIIRLPILGRPRMLRGASYLLGVAWLMWRRRYEYDAIYCRFLKEQAFAASLTRCLLGLRQPLVSCPANTGAEGDVYYVQNAPLPWLWRWAFTCGVSCVNALTSRLGREIAAFGLDHVAISHIPNGVVVRRERSRRARVDRTLRILSVGRLVEYKGHDVLLRAARCLLDTGRDFQVRLVGAGPLRPMIEGTIQRLGLGEHVRALGARLPEQVTDELQDADLFVLPSLYEGMPGALLEALAHGLPAVATRVSGSEDILDDRIGWLVPPGDAEALADAIGQALDSGPDRLREMGEIGRQKAARDYDIDDVAARYVALFEDLLCARKGRNAR